MSHAPSHGSWQLFPAAVWVGPQPFPEAIDQGLLGMQGGWMVVNWYVCNVCVYVWHGRVCMVAL